MKMIVVGIALCTVILGYAKTSQNPSVQVVPTYELYSWELPKETGWNFRLLYTTDRQKTREEVFNDQKVLHGIEQLKRELAKLPPSSRVIWYDRLTLKGAKIKGTEQLKYPPKKIIDEVKHYTDALQISISGPPE